MTVGPENSSIIELGARVHIFVQPRVRDEFTHLFRDVLGCNVSGFSVEFTELAPAELIDAVVDDERAFRGAWIEFRTDDVAESQQKLRRAGVPEFHHKGSSHAYFSAPGGQVFRLLDINYQGP